jgi:uncharacterized protein (DUF488 family)
MTTPQPEPEQPIVYTIGHSSRSLDELVRLLKSHELETVVDMRTIPRSRLNPQFNRDRLEKDLPELGFEYRHFPQLGGLRTPQPNSANTALQHEGFRGFADHMNTDEFASGVAEFIDLARKQRTTVMCAEAVPWKCHRLVLSDALIVRGVKVLHIVSDQEVKEHTLMDSAVVDGESITYPAPE